MDYLLWVIVCVLTIISKALWIILLFYAIKIAIAWYNANYGKSDIKSIITNVKEDLGFTQAITEEKGDN